MKKTLIIIGTAIIAGCAQINPGEAGFETQFGKIESNEILKEGLHFYSIIGGNIVVYDCKNQILKFKTEQYTKDIQQADTEISVTFNVDPTKIIEIHKTTGRDYGTKLIYPAIIGCAKDVFGKWNATDVVAKREEATDFISKTLKEKLKPYGINITLVELLDISFKTKFEDAVEAKQIAEQEANRAKNLTVKIREEAEQKVIAAQAEAKAMEVRAKALEQNKSLVEYEAVMKWDGKLPQYMMGNTVPFININNKRCN
jgi:regulator of protease activity HflC (stomatin/prohibitin superfamily)